MYCLLKTEKGSSYYNSLWTLHKPHLGNLMLCIIKYSQSQNNNNNNNNLNHHEAPRP